MNKLKSTPRLREGFTLIELLTVIAIIGILAAILIPTVGKVRERARLATDLSNLKQLSNAIMTSASDNKRIDPNSWVFRADELKNVYGSTEANTPDLVRDYAGGNRNLRSSQTFVSQYGLNPPADKPSSSFAFNSIIFPINTPNDGFPPLNPPSWLRRPIPVQKYLTRAVGRPILFLGVRNGNGESTTSAGNPGWLNPIYGGVKKTGSHDGFAEFAKGSFKVPVAFGDGSSRMVDFTARLAQFPTQNSDRWWTLQPGD